MSLRFYLKEQWIRNTFHLISIRNIYVVHGNFFVKLLLLPCVGMLLGILLLPTVMIHPEIWKKEVYLNTYYDFSLYLSVISHSKWKIWFLPSTIHFQYTRGAFSLVKLYPCGGETLYQLVYSTYVQFLLPLALQVPLISKVTYVRTPIPPFSKVKLFKNICNLVRPFCHSLEIPWFIFLICIY